MDLRSFDSWCRALLAIDALAKADASLNGIQVGRSEGEVRLVAFAVDACAESIRRAASAGAQVLFVHHGLFWGKGERIQGALRERLRLLLDADLALYACHLPLDLHPEVGNNAALARMLGLRNPRPFGPYRGVEIGFAGELDPPIGLDEAVRRILPDGSRPLTLLPGSRAELRSAAVVSGGAAMNALDAASEDIDLFVTGESSHDVYHSMVESGTAFLAAGHYATETWGVKAVAERLGRETGLGALFIDLPTGL
jgi:dinuclear metal center YbgI/SA1388 family protein